MIRLRTSRGGWRDIYTSNDASRDFLAIEPVQGRAPYWEDDALRMELASTAANNRRRDSLWLLVGGNLPASRVLAVVGVFTSPMARQLARRSLEGDSNELDGFEQELALMAASLDAVPDENGRSVSVKMTPANGKESRIFGRGAMTGLAVGLCVLPLWMLLRQAPATLPTTVALDSDSRKAMTALEERIRDSLPASINDDSVVRIRDSVIQSLPRQGVWNKEVGSAIRSTLQAEVFGEATRLTELEIDRVIYQVERTLDR